jgi:hypothetical protein
VIGAISGVAHPGRAISLGIPIATLITNPLTPVGDCVPQQSDETIRFAVSECLRQCSQGATPLGVMAEFLGELRDKGWEAADIRKVEQAARKVLAGVVLPHDDFNANPPV